MANEKSTDVNETGIMSYLLRRGNRTTWKRPCPHERIASGILLWKDNEHQNKTLVKWKIGNNFIVMNKSFKTIHS